MSSKIENIARERIDHPIAGPIIWAFCIWNWEVVVWLAGSVAKPDLAFAGICNWFSETGSLKMFIAPLASAGLFIFLGPLISTQYLRFQLWIGRIRNYYENRSRNLLPVAGQTFSRAMNALKAQHDFSRTFYEAANKFLGNLGALKIQIQRFHNNHRHPQFPYDFSIQTIDESSQLLSACLKKWNDIPQDSPNSIQSEAEAPRLDQF